MAYRHNNEKLRLNCTHKPNQHARLNVTHIVFRNNCGAKTRFFFFQNTHNGGSSKSQTRTNILFIFYLIFCFPSFTYISILMLVFPIRIVRCYTFYKNSLRQTLLCVGVVCSPNRAPLHCMDFIYLWQSMKKKNETQKKVEQNSSKKRRTVNRANRRRNKLSFGVIPISFLLATI